jgi:hypothetical protein
MKSLLFLILYSVHTLAQAQTANELEGKWCFTGLRTTIFDCRNDKLYIALLEGTDTVNFSRFLNNASLDTSIFVETSIKLIGDIAIITADFPNFEHLLVLQYAASNPTMIQYTGDVYHDSTHIITTNKNCDLQRPSCLNRLYTKEDIAVMSKMKSVEEFSRDDAFEFLLRVTMELKNKCNRCYAGFTDAYMNKVLMDMGFNPITKQKLGHSHIYSTSGVTYFIKAKFEKDKTIGKLFRLLVNQYVNGD